jgi:hypothetical protein
VDGAELFAFRTDLPDEHCPACGRRRLRWRIDLALPSPFPMVSTVGRGCTRDHAVSEAPSSWADVAELFAAARDAARAADPFTVWDARRADMRDRQAARATRLSEWEGRARRLALRLWSDDPRLSAETAAVIVAAVLVEPDQQPVGPTRGIAVS